MSLGGGSSTDTSSQSNSATMNMIPQWVSNAGEQNYALATQIAETPLQQYQGQMVASVAPQTQQAWNLAANSGNVGMPAQNAAMAGYLNTMSQTPAQITAAQAAAAPNVTAAQAAAAAQAQAAPATQAATASLSQLSNTNLQPYMNPYTQNVIDKTLPIMNQSLAQQQAALQGQTTQANAFGGSRQAIEQGTIGAQGALSEAQMAAQLNQANYTQAQQAGEFDVSAANNMGQFNANQLNQVGMYNQGQANTVGMYNAGQTNQVDVANAQLANQAALQNQSQANAMAQFNTGAQNTASYENQAAGLAQEGYANQASAGLEGIGQQQQAANAANYAMLTSAGAQQQQQAQNEINANMAKFQQAQNYPIQGLGLLESSLGMTPYDTASATSSNSASQSQTTQSPNLANLAQSGLQTLGSIFGGPAGAGIGALAGGSDRKIKKNIVHLGADPTTGVPIKGFNYKGDPAGMPKTIGPLAQDIEKRAPGSTFKVGGVMTVPRETLAAATPSVAHLPQHSSKNPRLPVQGALAKSDTVPAMLTPGEAVLTRAGADKIGRGKIAAANKAGVRGYARGTANVLPMTPSLLPFLPPSSPGVAKGISALTAFTPQAHMAHAAMTPHAGGPRVLGALGHETPRMPRVGGALRRG